MSDTAALVFAFRRANVLQPTLGQGQGTVPHPMVAGKDGGSWGQLGAERVVSVGQNKNKAVIQ